jgi:membrane-associated HD superfamily phosphohydrolase
MKRSCSKCHIEKDTIEFYKGKRSRCKSCILEDRKVYHQKNKTKILKRRKTRYEENREHFKEMQKKYRDNLDKERIDRNNEYLREWRREKPEKVKESNIYHRDRYRKMFDYNISIIMNEKGGCCNKCGLSDVRVLEFDHINREEKKFVIGRWHHLSIETLREETDKTQLLCTNCHRLKTITDLNFRREPLNEKDEYIINVKKRIGKCLNKRCTEEIGDDFKRLSMFEFVHNNYNDIGFTISQSVNDSNITIDEIKKEMKKCTLYCCNCRSLHSRKQFGWKTKSHVMDSDDDSN